MSKLNPIDAVLAVLLAAGTFLALYLAWVRRRLRSMGEARRLEDLEAARREVARALPGTNGPAAGATTTNDAEPS